MKLIKNDLNIKHPLRDSSSCCIYREALSAYCENINSFSNNVELLIILLALIDSAKISAAITNTQGVIGPPAPQPLDRNISSET